MKGRVNETSNSAFSESDKIAGTCTHQLVGIGNDWKYKHKATVKHGEHEYL
jgi:hypothetical protein